MFFLKNFILVIDFVVQEQVPLYQGAKIAILLECSWPFQACNQLIKKSRVKGYAGGKDAEPFLRIARKKEPLPT